MVGVLRPLTADRVGVVLLHPLPRFCGTGIVLQSARERPVEFASQRDDLLVGERTWSLAHSFAPLAKLALCQTGPAPGHVRITRPQTEFEQLTEKRGEIGRAHV